MEDGSHIKPLKIPINRYLEWILNLIVFLKVRQFITWRKRFFKSLFEVSWKLYWNEFIPLKSLMLVRQTEMVIEGGKRGGPSDVGGEADLLPKWDGQWNMNKKREIISKKKSEPDSHTLFKTFSSMAIFKKLVWIQPITTKPQWYGRIDGRRGITKYLRDHLNGG